MIRQMPERERVIEELRNENDQLRIQLAEAEHRRDEARAALERIDNWSMHDMKADLLVRKLGSIAREALKEGK
jgi:hypothetical protein